MSPENPPAKWICPLPLIHLEIQTRGDVYACCHAYGDRPFGNLHQQSLLEIFNSEKRRGMAREFIEGRGESVEFCRNCVLFERAGLRSPRQEQLDVWEEVPAELRSHPLSLGIRYSNKCNFACRSCRPSASTGWYPTARALNPAGNYKSATRAAPASSPISAQVEELLDHGLASVFFVGGEPLLEPDHYRTLEVIARKKKDCGISYNSNLSVLSFGEDEAIPLWNRLSSINLMVSLDGHGRRGEYIRKGLSWERLIHNWDAVRDQAPHVRLSIAFTISIYNVLHLPDFMEYLISDARFSEAGFTLYYCEDPGWLNIRALPQRLKDEVRRKYKAYLHRCARPDFRRRLESVLTFLDTETSGRHFDAFKAFTLRIDQVRNESFEEVFPELAELFESV